MAKKTLLQIVQSILNDMDSDEVNSISDTVEAYQVAMVVQDVYEQLLSQRKYTGQKKMTKLDSSGTPDRPTHLKLPENMKNLDDLVSVRYNTRRATDEYDKFTAMTFLYPDEFLHKTNLYRNNEENVRTITDVNGAVFNVKTDRAPKYWTSFDDEYVVFDAYDSAVDGTLQSSKTQVVGYVEPDFDLDDDFVPVLPSKMFPLLIAEAKSTCFINFKQRANDKAEQNAGRQRRHLSQQAWRTSPQNRFPNYGRKSTKHSAPAYHKNPHLDKG